LRKTDLDLIKKGIYFSKTDWETLQNMGQKEHASASYLARKAISEFIKKHKNE
jgi:hypothetical protein